jgi:predicted pyridoxine 5'-phosphate oxidase superfamily flavin-nucleotide-binding protein
MKTFAELAFTSAVRALQERHGSRAAYAHHSGKSESAEVLGPDESGFLASADSFFLATVSETGWPYVQHRGGPRGFLRVLSPTRLAFPDYAGNRQYVSAGNVSKDDRVSLIVMDWAHQRRLKIMGHLRFVPRTEADSTLLAAVETAGYRGRVERIGEIDVSAFDWNCPSHITPRFTLGEIESAMRTPSGRDSG